MREKEKKSTERKGSKEKGKKARHKETQIWLGSFVGSGEGNRNLFYFTFVQRNDKMSIWRLASFED